MIKLFSNLRHCPGLLALGACYLPRFSHRSVLRIGIWMYGNDLAFQPCRAHQHRMCNNTDISCERIEVPTAGRDPRALAWAFHYSTSQVCWYSISRRNLTSSSQAPAEHSNMPTWQHEHEREMAERECRESRERESGRWQPCRRTAGGRGYQIPVRSTVLQITRIEGITKNGSFSFIHVHTSCRPFAFFSLHRGSYSLVYASCWWLPCLPFPSSVCVCLVFSISHAWLSSSTFYPAIWGGWWWGAR